MALRSFIQTQTTVQEAPATSLAVRALCVSFALLLPVTLVTYLNIENSWIATFIPPHGAFAASLVRWRWLIRPASFAGAMLGIFTALMLLNYDVDKAVWTLTFNLAASIICLGLLEWWPLYRWRGVGLAGMVYVSLSLLATAAATAGWVHLVQQVFEPSFSPVRYLTRFAVETTQYAIFFAPILYFPTWQRVKRDYREAIANRGPTDLFLITALLVTFVASEWILEPSSLAIVIPALLLCATHYSMFFVACLSSTVGLLTLTGFTIDHWIQPAAPWNAPEIDAARLSISAMVVASLVVSHVVHERRELIEQLRHASSHDPLTDIYNRRTLTETGTQDLETLAAAHAPCGFLMIDIDFFKEVNDQLGHLVGDQALIRFARVVQETIGPGARLGRFGGEEFAVFLPGFTLPDSVAQAMRIRSAIENTPVVHDPNNTESSVTASIGLAHFDDASSVHLDDLIKAADQALYRAKHSGRNQVIIADGRNLL